MSTRNDWTRRTLGLAMAVVFLLSGVAAPAAQAETASFPPAPIGQDPTPEPVPAQDTLADMPPDLQQVVLETLAPTGGGAPDRLRGVTPGEYFGFSCAISDDGAYAVVGAYNFESASGNTGAAYVFHRVGETWSLQSRLQRAAQAQDGAGFGISVDIDGAGETIVVGEYKRDDIGAVDNGAAYVYTRSGEYWGYEVVLTHDNYPSAYYGWSVAIDRTGGAIVVGAYNTTYSGRANAGMAYMYLPSGSDWMLWQTVGGNAGDLLGYAVDIAYDGLWAASSPGYDWAGADSGRVTLFSLAGTVYGYLSASDAAAGDWFGRSLSFSQSFDRIVVGASRADIGGDADQGAAYLFIRTTGYNYTQYVKLVDPYGQAGDNFGVSVGINGDENKIVVGALDASGSFSRPGSGLAFLFTQSGGVWGSPIKLDMCQGGDRCGVSVAMARGATYMLVGGDRSDQGAAPSTGIAYAIPMSGTSLGVAARLVGRGALGEEYGRSAAISGDSETVLIGAPDAIEDAGADGAAYVYVRDDGAWRLQARLVNAGSMDFGRSVALSRDGNTALIGDPDLNDIGLRSGAAYVYVRTGETWALQQKLVTSDLASEDRLGQSVALSDDGNVALVGAPEKDAPGLPGEGAAYVFKRSGAAWSQRSKLVAGDADGGFGVSVSASSNGFTLLVGAPYVDVSGRANQGRAYTYKYMLVSNTWAYQSTLEASDGAAGDEFGASVSLSDDGLTGLIGAPRRDVSGYSDVGRAYVFTESGGAWSQYRALNFLSPTAADAGAMFGNSVSLSGNGWVALVGAPWRDNPESTEGAFLPFIRSPDGFGYTNWVAAPAGEGYFASAIDQDTLGNRVVVGDKEFEEGNITPGLAYVYPFAHTRLIYLPIARK